MCQIFYSFLLFNLMKKGFKLLRSTVRLRFRKSISEHHFQTMRKYLIMISNTIEGLFIEYSNTFLQKMCFFSCHVKNYTLIYGPFSCLIIVHFGPIIMENFVFFSNARSILELMRCNWNLTKLDVLTLFRLQNMSS